MSRSTARHDAANSAAARSGDAMSDRDTIRASKRASDEFFSEIQPDRKGQILDAALDEFADRGYAGGSMRRIAERVGVTEPAL
jgi:AcrR family transcriptional regulator